ncbi:MAG: hypothetical protein AB7G25_03220 [Sphingomonadaceae bacterium]
MKMKMLIGVVALTFSGAAFAAEPTAPKMECCCKKGEDGKMACCKGEATGTEKSGHEGHDMGDMKTK